VWIVLVREQGALRLQHETGRLHLDARERWADPMQCLSVGRSRTDSGGAIDDDGGTAGFQPLIDVDRRPSVTPIKAELYN